MKKSKKQKAKQEKNKEIKKKPRTLRKNNNEKITTIKMQEETKNRLEKLREHKRETYDDIIRKILYVLNAVREDSNKAKHILEFVDEKRKRMFETEKEIKKSKEDNQTKKINENEEQIII